MDYKTILGGISIAIQLFAYFIYFKGIYNGKTKPHAFTWFVWGVLSIIGFSAIYTSNGGAGSWLTFVNIIACFAVATIGIVQKHVKYDKYDWLALFGALLGAGLWWITKNPLYAVILISISDFICVIPTLRKAYRFPFEENALSFSMALMYYPLSILALESLTVTTWLYPASIVFTDMFLVCMILWRRKTLTK
ncbi:MAG: hypothetical protein K9L98_01585 [Candidatus Pacebacteria bacterium]|nr:hypothetical protein [Candidatus Paceibacterota bacterium]MCF7862685.1 hypothetical protein [Candidatus Paceibacterota bacterium]